MKSSRGTGTRQRREPRPSQHHHLDISRKRGKRKGWTYTFSDAACEYIQRCTVSLFWHEPQGTLRSHFSFSRLHCRMPLAHQKLSTKAKDMKTAKLKPKVIVTVKGVFVCKGRRSWGIWAPRQRRLSTGANSEQTGRQTLTSPHTTVTLWRHPLQK